MSSSFVMLIPRSFLLGFLPIILACSFTLAARKPNVVLIYVDDLGYGDVGCYGAQAVRTPHMDRIAREGLRFTDAHSPSATCTPSRYAMLTGEYAWRRQGTGIARGDAALILPTDRTTLQSMLKKSGYHTGVVGKWHLGLGPQGGPDWNGVIQPGPLETGFDYCFLIPATGDRVPCVYVENHRVVGLDPNDPIEVNFQKKVGDEPTGRENPDQLKVKPSHGHDRTIINGISRIGYMSGGKSARWSDEDMADEITRKAVAYIEEHQAEPFFLFFSYHDIHVPRVPHPRFVGQTKMGPRGDAIVQADWCTGQLLKTLDRLEIADETLVIFTSDNGPVIDDGYQDEAVEKLGNHRPSGPFRGGKYSNFEAGTRVPLMIRWPTGIQPGTSDALVCQIDFLSSLAKLTGYSMQAMEGPDSFDVLTALLGKTKQGREHLVEHGRGLALRQGHWKYIPPNKGPRINKNTATELGNSPEPLLYNLQSDIGERQNLAKSHPEKLQQMANALEKIKTSGRSRH